MFPDDRTDPTDDVTHDHAESTREEVLARREAAVQEREVAQDERERLFELHESNAGRGGVRVTDRDVIATARDELASNRDQSASRRDSDAAVRDVAATSRDQKAARKHPTPPSHPVSKTREIAAADRTKSAADRRDSGVDRAESEGDRTASAEDRQASAVEFASDQIDDLTDALLRGPGMIVLDHEVRSARAAGLDLVMGFVDVVGLKVVNDTLGHRAGDQVLKDVVAALRQGVRPDDPIVRYGGDEFICMISAVDMTGARLRLVAVHAVLAARELPVTVTIGLAQMLADDSVEELVARADADLYRQRAGGRSTGD